MGLLAEIIGGGGSEKCNRITEQRQPQQQTYPNNPRSGSGGNYLVLPPPYSGTPGSKATSLPPTLGPSPMSLSNVPRPPTNASSTTLWDMGVGFPELPASASQTVSANAHTRPNALHKSLSSTMMVFDTVGVGLLYGDGHGHTKSSSLTSTSTPRSELPGPLAAATSNTLIYNQHTHHHNYQCYHHRHNDYQMGIMAQQRQQSQLPQHHHGGGHMICNCAWEKSNSNVRVVTAINEGEPQELSSVAFAPDPVELP
ncbi:hypothetical protein GE21DRAFT_1060139 [Neurospora crassa]|nr:hypothetical protein GE21DRAFT_1060139 [Neurospora crassa]